MEQLLEDSLEKKAYRSLYAILFLALLLGTSVLLESFHKKHTLKNKSIDMMKLP